ncbi:MAG: DUF6352 family protein [Candidatus Competibacteraceae bacterium]|jgi:hypothetical protein|nr:DUF6352 family protein [Candidatus Competibacteraceae bacterium]
MNATETVAGTIATNEIWPSCGYDTVSVNDHDYLIITDNFLRHFFQRPELVPIDTSCQREIALFQALLDDPRRSVQALEIQAISDADARENYRVALDFRDVLLRHATLESAYLALTSSTVPHSTPPSLINLLVQLLLVHILRAETDPFIWRAAELFFRPQKVNLDSNVLLADAEVLERRRQPGGITVLQLLIRQAQGESGGIRETLSVLTQDSAERYWQQSEWFSFALSLGFREPGLAALCRVLAAWIQHFHRLSTRITPIQQIETVEWYWHIGLDVESNQLLNTLYQGEAVEEETLRRILALFRVEFEDERTLRTGMSGHAVHLGMAMDSAQLLRLKPQNLLLNLPLAESS